jgi:site-specific DNA recombinase
MWRGYDTSCVALTTNKHIMKSYFAYIRVSTPRQGEEGVSLQEQRRAILEYSTRKSLGISQWFEEQISAAKRGRPLFTRMVALLKQKKAVGVIIHKIDRGSRNLKDWADLGELMDQGVEIHFAHESLDLHSRTGRLSADILAVVAADYIRNLREEIVKGINGRLRQGLFPFAAPVGYVNTGPGKAKTIDQERGPFVKLAFELYATREHSLQSITDELWRRGLRNSRGHMLSLNQWAVILRNPFYMGLILLKNRKDTFPGVHTPLIGSSLFNQVQLILDGKRSPLRQQNRFLFQLMTTCEHCKRKLIGERQKGRVYYRCHARTCPGVSIREEKLQHAIVEALQKLTLAPEEEIILKTMITDFGKRETETLQGFRREAEAELDRVRESIQVLLQKFLDKVIPKETFEEGHGTLLMQRAAAEERVAKLEATHGLSSSLHRFFGELGSTHELFSTGTFEQMRKILAGVFAGISANHEKTVHATLTQLMEQIANREKTEGAWAGLFPLIVKELALK